MNQNGDFFWRRRREDGADAGSGARRGSGRGGRRAGHRAGAGRGWRRGRGRAGSAGAYLQRPRGAAGPGQSRAGKRGAGRGVRAAHTARRAAHMRAPAPPTFDSFTAGGRGRTLAVFTRPPLRGRGRWGLSAAPGCEIRGLGGTCLQGQEVCHACLGQESLCGQSSKLRHARNSGHCPKSCLTD